MKHIQELFLRPATMRIILVLKSNQVLTTQEIKKRVNIPQATLYRYIQELEKNNIISLVNEKFKRGAYERSYSLNNSVIEKLSFDLLNGSIEVRRNFFMSFIYNVAEQFNDYLQEEGTNMKKDNTGFRSYPLYITDENNEDFINEIEEVINKYIKIQPTKESISYVFSLVHSKGSKS